MSALIKRTAAVLVAVVTTVVSAAGAVNVFAAEEETLSYGSFTYEVTENKVNITGYTGVGGDVSVPSKIDGREVVSIGDEVFWYNETITGVNIPDTIEYIGARAFSGCTKLVTAVIPDSVTEIGDACFLDCSALVSVNIPSEILRVGGFAFDNTRWITKYSECDSIIFGNTVFYKYSGSADKVTIPDGIVSISSNAFSGSSVSYVSIPDSVISIGDYCFLDCKNLRSLAISNDMFYLGVCCIGYNTAGKDFETTDGFVLYADDDTLGAEYAQQNEIERQGRAKNATPDDLPVAEICSPKPYVVGETSSAGLSQNGWTALIIMIASCVLVIGGIAVITGINDRKNGKSHKHTKKDKRKKK